MKENPEMEINMKKQQLVLMTKQLISGNVVNTLKT